VLEVNRIIQRNLLVDNDLLRLPADVGCVLAGGSLLANFPTDDTKAMLFDELVSLVQWKMPEARHFLMVGYNGWTPRNRIVMYHKLWRSMDRRISLPAGRRSEEYLIESNEGVKFFGFLECEEIEPRQLLNVLRTETACTLVAIEEPECDRVLRDVASRGWEKKSLAIIPQSSC
jgi:hypothetical protein